MTNAAERTAGRVGPVLEASELGRAVAAAIVSANAGARIDDRGAYLRVSAPGRCFVARRALEAALGREFSLPRELELIMPAFQGLVRIDDEGIEWRLEGS